MFNHKKCVKNFDLSEMSCLENGLTKTLWLEHRRPEYPWPKRHTFLNSLSVHILNLCNFIIFKPVTSFLNLGKNVKILNILFTIY